MRDVTSVSVSGADTTPSVRLSPNATNLLLPMRGAGTGGGVTGPAGGSGGGRGRRRAPAAGRRRGVGVGWFGLSPEQPAAPARVTTIRQARTARMDLPFYGLPAELASVG